MVPSSFLRLRPIVALFACGFVATARGATPAPSVTSTASRGSFRSVIQPKIDIPLSSRAAGVVEKVHVAEGASVKKDDPLISLDADQEKAEVAQAEATLRGAKFEQERAAAEFDRIAKLMKEENSSTSTKIYVDAKAGAEIAASRVDQAAAALQLAQARLANRTITSPFDGTFFRSRKQVGESVDRYETVARMVDVTSLELMVFCDAKYFAQFQTGQRVEMRVVKSAEEQPIVSGVIIQKDPFVDPSLGTFRIKIKLESSANAAPGLQAVLNAPGS